ncbi:MAG: NADH-quinone oxidoreductase subunit M [Phycisphaera sp.]|nr:NADH-quinone oxidoreductase subunit M [Phycisphaera sp.]
MIETYSIPVLLLAPLLGGFGVAMLPKGNPGAVRTAAAFWSLLTFVVSVIAAVSFDWSKPADFQLTGMMPWISEFGLSFTYGVDSISLWLVLLSTFLTPIVIFGSFKALSPELQGRTKEFFVWLLLLESAMVGTFVARDILFFYLCFEFTLVPLYFLIGVFGSYQRLYAAKVFFLYTFTGSMLTFAALLYVAQVHAASHGGVWSFAIDDLYTAARSLDAPTQGWILAALLAGFAVKVPLFPVHTWLPLAHTEAPTAGSVILAGVLLKLGTYGLLRLAIPMCPEAVVSFAPTIGVLAVIGILYTALICWVQKDIKKLIAYSSVSHLGFCVLGMFALNLIGGGGSVMYMINHGLSTGALFLCVGMIYERFHTREMAQMSGLGRAMPVWATFMVFFCLASVGLPGLNGFVGEFLTLLGAFVSQDLLGWHYALAAGVGMIFGAIYILYMVGRVVMGPTKIPSLDHDAGDEHGHHTVKDLTAREIAVLVPLAIGCLVLGLYPKPILSTLDEPIRLLIDPARGALAARHGDETPRLTLVTDEHVASAPSFATGDVQ